METKVAEAVTPLGPVELGYWKIRGLAAPLRMMLAYAGQTYENKMFETGEEWFAGRKPAVLEMDPLANLPYVIDGNTCVTQSTACMVYLAEKLGLYGGIKDLELLSEVYDLRNSVIDLVYPFKKVTRTKEEFDASTEPQCSKVAPKFYAKLEASIINDTKFLLKDTPCACDFHCWEMLDQHELIAKEFGHESPLKAFPKLTKYYAAFKALPQLQAYFASDLAKLPCNNSLGNAYFC